MSINYKIYKNIRILNCNEFSDDFILYLFFGNLVKRGLRDKGIILLTKLLLSLKRKFPKEIPLMILKQALVKIKPVVGLRSKKVAGITYQLPYPVDDRKGSKLAVRWFFSSLDLRKEKTIEERMLQEVCDLLKGKGISKTKKDSLEKVALDNRAFTYFLK
jgi:small subunit ribosomal protein S7